MVNIAERDELEIRSPLTNSPVIRGGICLGCTEPHAKATDWAIREMVSYGKHLGNVEQWYIAIYLILSKAKLPHLQEHM